MELDNSLIGQIDAFLVASGMTPTRFGERALKDPNLVFQIREGRWLRGPTRSKVLAFMKRESEPDSQLQPTGT